MEFRNTTNQELKLNIYDRADAVRAVPRHVIVLRGGRLASWNPGGSASKEYAVAVFRPGLFDEHVSTHEPLRRDSKLTLNSSASRGVFGHIAHTTEQAATNVARVLTPAIEQAANDAARGLKGGAAFFDEQLDLAGRAISQTFQDAQRNASRAFNNRSFTNGINQAANDLKQKTQYLNRFGNILEGLSAVQSQVVALMEDASRLRFNNRTIRNAQIVANTQAVQSALAVGRQVRLGGAFFIGAAVDFSGSAAVSSIPVPVGWTVEASFGYLVIFAGPHKGETAVLWSVGMGPMIGSTSASLGLLIGLVNFNLIDFTLGVSLDVEWSGIQAGSNLGGSLAFNFYQGLPGIGDPPPRISRFGDGAGIFFFPQITVGGPGPNWEGSLAVNYGGLIDKSFD